jgi:putative FmdB family regulatory protein
VPTYSYECTECGNRFDMVQAFTDDALTTCEQCSGRLRKLFKNVGIVFKGSGFYRTDSRDESKKSKTPTNGSAASDTASSSGSGEKNGSSTTSSEKSASSPAASTAGASA